MNRYELWLAGFILVGVILSVRVECFTYKDSCDVDNSIDGLETINCSLLRQSRIYTDKEIPSGLGKNPQVFYFVPLQPEDLQSVNLCKIPFRSYPDLKRIIIRRNQIMREQITTPGADGQLIYAENNFYSKNDIHVLSTIFEKLTKLEYLECSYSYYYEILHFVLPQNLKTYNISGNRYLSIEIRGSLELDDLNANYNADLANAPLFRDPVPPLAKLRLKGCPLTDMTIFDIAPLCNLELLELEFPPNNRFVNQIGYCNCTILKQWANQTHITIESLKCYEPKQGEKIECPTEQYIKDASKVRKKCPLLKRGVVTKAIFSIMKYIFFSILFLLLLAAVILYIIRHYHLREWWREHHLHILSKAQPTPIMEESVAEEETPPVDGNAEWV